MKYAYAVLVGNAMLLYAGRVLCRCLNENALAMLLINHEYDDDYMMIDDWMICWMLFVWLLHEDDDA